MNQEPPMATDPQHLISNTVYEWLLLSLIPGLSSRTLLKMQRVYPEASDVLRLIRSGQWRHMGFTKQTRTWLECHSRDPSLGLTSQIEKTAQWINQGGQVISWRCLAYPELLQHIYDPPIVLYVLGDVHRLKNSDNVAMVGSRKATRLGVDTAYRFSYELSQQGWQVVSGMALGIDAAAHEGVISHYRDTSQGSTVAVVATGLDQTYPSSHKQLQAQILNCGCVISEYPLGTVPKANYFPRRNRIISGLSRGVIVVEASEKSGSLVSARCALEQNRDVFAVPGAINNPQAIGCHQLIQQGAKLVTSVDEVLVEFERFQNGVAAQEPLVTETEIQPSQEGLFGDTENNKPISLSKLSVEPALAVESIQMTSIHTTSETAEPYDPILACLQQQSPCSADQLMIETGLSWPELSQKLLLLELEGRIASTQGGYQMS